MPRLAILAANVSGFRSIVINHVETTMVPFRNIACMYVYFDYQDESAYTVRGLLLNMIWQLLNPIKGEIHVPDNVRKMHSAWSGQNRPPQVAELVELLVSL